MFNALLSFLLRFVEASFVAAPYLLCGLLLAGVFRVLLGRSRLQQLLAGDTLSGPVRGWGLGLLLPVCSIGVLPIARELLRAEVPRSTVFTFLLAAPLFHPLTLAYGLSVMDLPLLLFLLGGSLVVLSIASRFVKGSPSCSPSVDEETVLSEVDVAYGIRRMGAIGVIAADHWRTPLRWEVLLALIGVGLAGALLDPSNIGNTMADGNGWAGPLAVGLSLPLYVTSVNSIMVLEDMFEHGNSLAAAFALLVFGVGLNLGTLLALRNLFGFRAACSGLAVVFVGVVLVGSLASSTFYQPIFTSMNDHEGHGEGGHTHAFDSFARPSALSGGTVSYAVATRLFLKAAQPGEVAALVSLLLLGLAAWTFRLRGFRDRLRSMLASHASSELPAGIDRPLSRRWLYAIGIIGGSVAAYLIAITYFVAPSEVFEDMRMVRTEALSAVKLDNRVAAQTHFERWEQLARRLPIGSLLRGTATGDQRMSAQILRQSLGAVRECLAENQSERIDWLLEQSELAYQQCQDVYAGKPLVLSSDHETGMPTKVTDDAERELYLTPGGIYSHADIAANGNQTASQRYAGFRSAHVMNPPVGSLLCPVTLTKANANCTWTINGREYQFCCPPCIDEFVRTAKENPEDILPPEEYIKR